MNTNTQRDIAASIRDQALDVRLGLITKDEWNRLYDAAVAEGVTFTPLLASFRASA